MRLDLFLKLSRLCPRRTLAQKLCDAGFVLLNERPTKPGHAVKTGDQITIRSRNTETVARVLNVPATHNVSRAEARLLVEILSQTELKTEI